MMKEEEISSMRPGSGIVTAVLFAAAAIAFASCTLPWLNLDGGKGGEVHISIMDPLLSEGSVSSEAASASRTIAPTAGSPELTYHIEAWGPASAHIGPVEADSSSGHTFSNLAAGEWNFVATGKSGVNSVTTGTTMVAVTANQFASGTITMSPAAGNGSYTFTVYWPADQSIAAPTVSLKTAGGSDADPGPNKSVFGAFPNTSGVGITGTGLAAGSYTLDLTLTRYMSTIHLVETLQVYNTLSSTKNTTLTLDDFTARPAAPSGFTAQALNRTVVLDWTDNAITEFGFALERNVDAGGWAVLSSTIAANAETYTDSDVSFDHTYQYRINAVNDNGYSSASPTTGFSPVRVASVWIGEDFYLVKGGTADLTAAVTSASHPTPAFDDRVVWTSSNAAVAAIDGRSGHLEAFATGTSTITATTVDGAKSDTRVVTVCPEPVISAFDLLKAENEMEGVSSDCYGLITGTSIAVTVPYGTDPTALVATFTSSVDGGPGQSEVLVDLYTQESNVTANDFTDPVTYTVVAADGTVEHYTVTLSFALPGTAGLTFVPNPQISVSIAGNPTFPNPLVLGADATFNASIAPPEPVDGYQWYMDGAALSGATASGVTTGSSLAAGAHRIGLAVFKTVGSQTYRFSGERLLNVTLPSAKVLTSFSFASPAVTGTIDELGKTVSVLLPYGSSTAGPYVARFSHTGERVTILGADPQTSGVTANSFEEPLHYYVHSIDGSYADYTVTATVAENPAKAITSFTIKSPDSTGTTIDEGAGTIAVIVPYGTSLGTLTATFTTTGSSVTIGPAPQTSGSTPNDFTGPVDYVVHAADGTTRTYRVTVTNDYGHVYYDGNGNTSGSPPTDPFCYTSGDVVTVLGKSTLSKLVGATLYRFLGWNSEAGGGGRTYQPGQTFDMPTHDVTLYATWAPYTLRDIGPGGGYVFYDKGNYDGGWRYLEAAPYDQSSGNVWWSGVVLIGASGSDVTQGQANTTMIVNTSGSAGSAAKLCDDLVLNGYSDWFLPSNGALSQMYSNLAFFGLGSFVTTSGQYYWSSTEQDSANAWRIEMWSGSLTSYGKNLTYKVRAVRAF